MTQLLPSQEREREETRKKKKVGEKERWRFCFGLVHSFYPSFFFFFFDESIFISFRCNFCTWVHLACGLLLSFLLVFFFNIIYIYIYIYTRRWEVEAQLYSDNIT